MLGGTGTRTCNVHDGALKDEFSVICESEFAASRRSLSNPAAVDEMLDVSKFKTWKRGFEAVTLPVNSRWGWEGKGRENKES